MAYPIQPELPLMCREVEWYVATEERRPRTFLQRLLAKAATARLVNLVDGHGSPLRRSIDAGKIDTLTDPQLRYALRFADAANAMDWIADSDDGTSSYAHNVTIHATDEGIESRLLAVTYSGNDGAFEADLHRFKPAE